MFSTELASPFPERRALLWITQILIHKGNLLLYGSGGNGKHKSVAYYAIVQAIVFHIIY